MDTALISFMKVVDDSKLKEVIQCLPPGYNLTGKVKVVEYKTSGGNCSIYLGRKAEADGTRDVAVRRPQIGIFLKDPNIINRIPRELHLWSKLNHKRLLPLLGFLDEGNIIPTLVTPWMHRGDARKYVEGLKTRDSSSSVISLVRDIADGIAYLHNLPEKVVHGDLKAANILISDSGSALIADFGLSRRLNPDDFKELVTVSSKTGTTVLWMASEQITFDKQVVYTEQTDVWSFGMLICEMITRKDPYYEVPLWQVFSKIGLATKPDAPSDLESWHITERLLWNLCQTCWDADPAKRPDMKTLLADIERIIDENAEKQNEKGANAIQMDTNVSLAVEFAPVPWISPAVDIVGEIMKLCRSATLNKQSIRQLGSRCESFLTTLKDVGESTAPDRLNSLVSDSVSTFSNIRDRMLAWATMSRMKQIMFQNNITDEIRQCHQDIDRLLNKLQVGSNWLTSFESNRGVDQKELILYLTDAQNSKQILQTALAAQTQQLQQLMLLMQNALATYERGDRRQTELASNLYSVANTTTTLLPEVDLKHGEVRRVGSHPIGGSVAFDIWEGVYLGREKCTIKVIRGVETSPNVTKRFLREAKIWRKIFEIDKGEYILPFYGVCSSDGPYPYMVSPWMQNGDALSYVKKYPMVNRKLIVRRLTAGLRLLHTQTPPIIHGDVKAQSILINDAGMPLLADFGLSKIMEDITGMPFTQSRGVSDSYRWFAPELFCAPGILTPASDVFAYAMTVLELMTGEQPYSHIRRTPEVVFLVQSGERPRRPRDDQVIERGLDDDMWNLLTRCWQEDPALRPTIQQVLEELLDD